MNRNPETDWYLAWDAPWGILGFREWLFARYSYWVDTAHRLRHDAGIRILGFELSRITTFHK